MNNGFPDQLEIPLNKIHPLHKMISSKIIMKNNAPNNLLKNGPYCPK